METEQLNQIEQMLSQNDSPIDIDIGSQLPDIASNLAETYAPFLIASALLSVLLLVLYVSSALRRRKVDKAILDIQKVINEMNERDKARSMPAIPPSSPQSSEDKILATELTETPQSTEAPS